MQIDLHITKVFDLIKHPQRHHGMFARRGRATAIRCFGSEKAKNKNCITSNKQSWRRKIEFARSSHKFEAITSSVTHHPPPLMLCSTWWQKKHKYENRKTNRENTYRTPFYPLQWIFSHLITKSLFRRANEYISGTASDPVIHHIFSNKFPSRTDAVLPAKAHNIKSDCSAKCQPMQKNRTNVSCCLLVNFSHIHGPRIGCTVWCADIIRCGKQKVIQSSSQPLQQERKYFVTIAST